MGNIKDGANYAPTAQADKVVAEGEFQFAAAYLDLAASETIMIGDRRHDIAGARHNGVRSIGVLYGFGGRDELVAAGADRLCAQPDDLAGVVAGLR